MNIALGIGNAPLKSIPYPAETHNDGTNHGFLAIKGNQTEVADLIEEAKNDPHLAGVLREINCVNSPLFSVGCANLHIIEDIRGQGYVEIAFNTLEEAKDSASYFRLFERFTKFTRTSTANLKLQYLFVIERALLPSHNVEAFTVQIWLMIGSVPTRQEVENIWRAGLNMLARFAATLPISPSGTPIF